MPDHPKPLVTEAMKGAGGRVILDALDHPGINPAVAKEFAERIYLAMRKCAPFDGHPTRETRIVVLDSAKILRDYEELPPSTPGVTARFA